MKRVLFIVALLAQSAFCARGPSDPVPSSFHFYPSTNVWFADISGAPVSSSNTLWMDGNNGHTFHDLHPNFGNTLGDGTWNGIPYNLVWSTTTPRQNVTITTYATESDTPPVGGIPIPSDVIAEGDIAGSTTSLGGDTHLILLDVSSGTIYELFNSSRNVGGGWTAAQLTIWFSTSNVMRPVDWTSADAAGLGITVGLIRWDEIQAGVINHAIRFELELTHGPYIWPGRHNADSGGTLNPPFGMRVRMKASVDLSSFSGPSLIIFTAMKKYGMILADNGGDWFVDGAPNSNWDDNQLHTDFINVGFPHDIFEVVDESTWIVDPNSLEARAPGAPAAPYVSGNGTVFGGGTIR
jgi:hypothetical protein